MVYSANPLGTSVPSGAAPNLKDASRVNEGHLSSERPSADVGDGMLLARNPGGSRSTTMDRAIQYRLNRLKNPGGPAYQLPGVGNIVPFRGSVTSLSSQAQSNVRAWNNKTPGGALQTDGQVIRVRLPNGFAPVVGFDPRVNPGVHAEETLVVGRQNEIIRFPNAVALPGTNYTNADLVRLMQARGEVENGRPTQKNTVALDVEKQKYESAYAQSRNSQSNPVQGPEAPDLTLGTRQGYQGRTVQPAQYVNPVPKAQPITNPEIAKYPDNSQLVSALVQLGRKLTLKPIIGKGAQQLDSGGSVEVRPGGRNYVDIKLSYPEGSLTYNFPVKPNGSPDVGNLPKNVERLINDQAKKQAGNQNAASNKNPYGTTGSDIGTNSTDKKPTVEIKELKNREIDGTLPKNVLQDLQYYATRPNLRATAKAGTPAPSGAETSYKDLGSAIKLTMPYQGKTYTYNMGVNPNGSVNKNDLPEALKSPPLISDVLGNQAGKLPSTTDKKPTVEIKKLENREIDGTLPKNVLQDLQYYATRPNLRATAKAGAPAPSGAETSYKDLGSAIKLTMPYRGKTYTYNMGVNPNGSVDKNNLPEALKSPPLITDVLGNQAGKLPSTTEIERFKNPFRKQEPLTKLLNNLNKIQDPKKASQAIENLPGETKKNQAPNNFSCEATITRIHGVAQNGKDYTGFVSVDVRPYINFPDGTRKIDNTALAGVTMRNDIKNGPLNDYKFQVRLDTIKGPGNGTGTYASNELSYVDGIKQYANSRGLSNLLGNANRYAAEGRKVGKNGFPIPFVTPNTTKKTEYNSRINFGRVVGEASLELSPPKLTSALNGTISLPSKNVTIATETASLGGVQDVIRKIPYTFSNVKIDEANNYMFNNTTNKVKAFCVCTGTAGKPVKVEANFTPDSASTEASILTGRVDNNPRSRPFNQLDGAKWPADLFNGWR